MRCRPTGRAVPPMILGAGMATALAAVLAGCSQPEPRTAPETLPGTVDVLIQPTLLPFGSGAIGPSPSGSPESTGTGTADEHENPFDASDRLTGASCTNRDGSWSFTGTMTNPDPRAVTYTIGVTLLANSDLTEVVTKEITVTVPAGSSVPVAAKDFHRSTEAGLTCLTGVTIKGSD